MKKLALSLLPLIAFAQSFIVSDIPLPKTYIENVDPYKCDEECLQEYLNNDMIFSFLAHASTSLNDESLQESKSIYMSVLNMGAFHSNATLKIAMLLPSKKIGKYAATTTNAAFSYLLQTGNPFVLKSYNIQSEETQEIQTALLNIQTDGFDYVIAPFTKMGVENTIEIDPSIHIYFPTINKKDVNTSSNYLYFGGIDYEAQSDMLLKEATSPLVIFSDKSSLGRKLAAYQEDSFINPHSDINELEYTEESAFDTEAAPEEKKEVIKYFLSRRTTNLEPYLKDNEKIIEGSFFINTPIIKSGMILSQLTLYDTNATNVLSTQINYNPLLLSMTQYVDRKHMIVANSLTTNNNVLIETNSLLNNDIVYDWINYSTTVGTDYFHSLITNEPRKYDIPLNENQMAYGIELLKPSLSKFIPYSR